MRDRGRAEEEEDEDGGFIAVGTRRSLRSFDDGEIDLGLLRHPPTPRIKRVLAAAAAALSETRLTSKHVCVCVCSSSP